MNFINKISDLDSKKLIFICIFLIAIVYINSLDVYFIWDDYYLVVKNENIRNPNLYNVFKPAYKDANYFRPLQILSYALDYRIWKLNPFGYHLTNIILHSINAILLYLLLFVLFNNRIISFLSALLFAVNPIFSSSVTYISGRADILLLLFSLIMIRAVFNCVEDNKINWFYFCVSFASLVCTLLSKEIGIISFILLFLVYKIINKHFVSGFKNLFFLPYVIAIFLYLYSKLHLILGWHIGDVRLHSFFFGLLTLVKGLGIYTLLSFWPIHLRMGRSITIINSFMDSWFFISILILIGLVLLFIFVSHRNRLSLFGLTWFYLPLLILLFFNYLFAHRGNELLLPETNLYFSYPGFLISFFSILQEIKLKRSAKKILIFFLLCIVPIYAVLTIAENSNWQDEIRFFERIVEYNKDSKFNYLAYANLGKAYEKNKMLKEAEKNYYLAAQTSDRDPYFYNALAYFYIRQGNFDQAINILNFSKELNKRFLQTYLLLGIAYNGLKQTDNAVYNFQQAISIDPQNQIARQYLELLRSNNK